jgi:autotransporter-associated beta strand protein
MAGVSARGGGPVYWDTSNDPGYQGGSATWGSQNWNNNGVRGGWSSTNQDTAVFAGTPGASIQVVSPVTAAAVQADVGGYTLGLTTGATLTISTGSVVANADLTITAPITAPSGIFKSGAGVLTLGATNTIGGAITVLGGTLSFAGEANLGAVANDIQLSGGTLRCTGSGLLALNSGRTVFVNAAGGGLDTPRNLQLPANGQLAGSGALVKLGAQPLWLSGSNTAFTGSVDVTAGTLQLSNPLAANGRPIRLEGGSRLLLKTSAPTDFLSAVTVAAGTAEATIEVDGIVGQTNPTHRIGNVTVEPGATLRTTGINKNYVTMKGVSLAGTLRIAADTAVGVTGAMSGPGGVTFEGGSNLPELFSVGLLFSDGAARTVSNPFNPDASGSGRVVVGVGGTGTALTYDGRWEGGAGGAGASNYVVLRDGGAFVAGANAHLNTTTADVAGARPFTVIGNGTNNTFELGQAFVADRTEGGTVADAFSSLEVRNGTLVTRASASLPVVRRQDGFSGTHRAGVITLSGTAGARWVVTGANQTYDGNVTIADSATIVAEQNLTHAGTTASRFDGQFQIPSGGVALVKEGAGRLTLTGSQGYAPGAAMRVAGGSVRFDSDPGAGWYAGNFARGADGNVVATPAVVGTLAVVAGGSAGAMVEFAAPVSRLASLSVEAGGTARVVESSPAGGRTLVTRDLSVSGGGRLDLGNNRLVVEYDGVNSPIASVLNLIKTGYGTPAARWQGPGIISSAAAADPEMGIGYGEAADVLGLSGGQTGTFGGATVDATTVLARFTRLGDANLDGRVDFADFQRLERGFGRIGQAWSAGDFDYDGSVTRADFKLLYTNFDRGLDPAGGVAIDALAPSVPEPGWAFAFAICLTIRGRRHRNRHVKIENL